MGWFPSSYPDQSFFIARHFYHDVLNFMERIATLKDDYEGQNKIGRRIFLINLSIARCINALWRRPIHNSIAKHLPESLIFSGNNVSEVKTNLFMEFCRQIRDTGGDEYEGGIREHLLVDEFDGTDDSYESPERDRRAHEMAIECIEIDTWSYLHESDEFDLLGGFGGYGEWRGGGGHGSLPSEFNNLPWDTPSLVEGITVTNDPENPYEEVEDSVEIEERFITYDLVRNFF